MKIIADGTTRSQKMQIKGLCVCTWHRFFGIAGSSAEVVLCDCGNVMVVVVVAVPENQRLRPKFGERFRNWRSDVGAIVRAVLKSYT